MSKVAPAVLEEFGRSVIRARSLQGWTLDQLAGKIKPTPGKSFLSNIEKGKRDISPTTVGKLIRALGLEEVWIDRFLDSIVAPEAEETRLDRNADRLMRLADQDETAPLTAEPLLIKLAEEFSGGSHADPNAAYKDLRAALQAAADIKARGALPQNVDDQLQAVLREVSRLNDLGEPEAAANVLEEAMKRADAQREAIFGLQLNQDRIRNNPAAAAARVLAQLRSVAHPGGLFNATHAASKEWHDRGYDEGIGFDLHVALHLARANLDRANKGPQRGQAQLDLGRALHHLGEREGHSRWLTEAIRTFRDMVAEFPRKRDPRNWALTQDSLGNALQTLGKREAGLDRLQQAVQAHRDALLEYTRDRVPLEWAMTQNNLGIALQSLGEREGSNERLGQAVQAYRDALLELTRDWVPPDWATTQNNLGTALAALGEREGSTERLALAVQAYRDALMERTRDRVPLYWALTQNNLGAALRTLGEREGSTERLEQAVQAYRDALLEQSRDRVPLDWAMSQNNLGHALKTLGEREPSTQRLEQAVQAYRDALLEWTRDRVPLDWAMSWGNMGEALTLLADRTDDLAMARQALLQLQEAEAVLREGGHQPFATYSADRIPRAQAVIDRLSPPT